VKKILASKQTTLEVPPDLSHLPDSVGALVPLYRACIVRFDAAVHAREFSACAAEVEAAGEIVERALSLPRFANPRKRSGFRYCHYDVADIFCRLTRATPGAVPLFGQTGRFVASLSITRVRFDTSGLVSIGMSAYIGAAWSFEIRAAEPERAFFSETGYRSFMLQPLDAGEPSQDVAAWCVGHLRHWWNSDGGKPTKFQLRRIVKHAAPMPPAEEEEHDDDAEECAECLPVEDEPDDDGRTAIGNGYRSEPVSKTSTQLSLF